MTMQEAANHYQTTVLQIQRLQAAFIHNEGYHDDGHQAQTLAEYLDYHFSRPLYPLEDNSPWQKGDDCPQ